MKNLLHSELELRQYLNLKSECRRKQNTFILMETKNGQIWSKLWAESKIVPNLYDYEDCQTSIKGNNTEENHENERRLPGAHKLASGCCGCQIVLCISRYCNLDWTKYIN